MPTKHDPVLLVVRVAAVCGLVNGQTRRCGPFGQRLQRFGVQCVHGRFNSCVWTGQSSDKRLKKTQPTCERGPCLLPSEQTSVK